MKRILYYACVGCFFLNLQSVSAQKREPVQYDKLYKTAVFTDTERQAKITRTFSIVDKIFRDYADSNHLPGVAYGIVVDGKLIHKGNIGYTDIEKKIAVTSASMFRIASMSKSFTTLAILKLRDEGKLDLDVPAYIYIPELKDLKYPTLDAPHITIRHLMTHGAGFPEDNPWGDRQLADTDKELLALIKNQLSFSNTPDITMEYSNLGFALQGMIITKVSGMPYQDYIRKNILQPLGMAKTTYEYADVAADKLAHGYRWLNNKWNEEELLHDTKEGSWGAMGSMISSIDEFGNYMGMHLSAWPPGNAADKGPVKRSSVREMHHPWRWTAFVPNYRFPDGRTCAITAAYGYGLGWMKDCEGKTYIAHSGGLPGFGSQWRIMPEYGIGIVSFANRTYSPMGFVNLKVLDTIIKLAGLKPRELPTSKILEQRKNDLVKILPEWKNAEQSGIFAENFFPDNPIDTLKKYAKELFTKAGKIISVSAVKPENQLRGSFIITGEKKDIEIFFTLTPENPPLIQEYHIKELKREK